MGGTYVLAKMILESSQFFSPLPTREKNENKQGAEEKGASRILKYVRC